MALPFDAAQEWDCTGARTGTNSAISINYTPWTHKMDFSRRGRMHEKSCHTLHPLLDGQRRGYGERGRMPSQAMARTGAPSRPANLSGNREKV